MSVIELRTWNCCLRDCSYIPLRKPVPVPPCIRSIEFRQIYRPVVEHAMTWATITRATPTFSQSRQRNGNYLLSHVNWQNYRLLVPQDDINDQNDAGRRCCFQNKSNACVNHRICCLTKSLCVNENSGVRSLHSFKIS